MSVFYPDVAYQIDPNCGRLYERYDTDSIDIINSKGLTPALERPFQCRGIRPLDLVIHAALIDEDGVSDINYIVKQYAPARSMLMPLGLLESDVSQLTSDLARKIATLSPDEVIELDLGDHVLRAINVRFPNIKPFGL